MLDHTQVRDVTSPGLSDTQSYSILIRDAFYAALDRDSFFDGYNKRKNKMLTIAPGLLPYLGVYIVDEQMAPDGDANAGCIRFMHTLRIGFSAMILNNDQVAAEIELDRVFWRIMNTLWTDAYINNVIDTYNPTTGISNPDNVRFEGIVRGMRRHVFGSSGFNNETPMAEMQYEVSVLYRTMFYPTIVDDFEELRVRTGIKIGETPEEMARRNQTGYDVIFPTSRVKQKEEETKDG